MRHALVALSILFWACFCASVVVDNSFTVICGLLAAIATGAAVVPHIDRMDTK